MKLITKTIAGAALAASAVVGVAALPTAASAQTYCGRNNAGAGALIGGVAGAVAGSNLSARGRATEGSVLGGVAGALLGSAIGRSTNNCGGYYGGTAYYDNGYYDNGYGYGYGATPYYGRVYPPPAYYAPAPVVVAPPPPVVVVPARPYYGRGYYGGRGYHRGRW
jgi:hypothetical protein